MRERRRKRRKRRRKIEETLYYALDGEEGKDKQTVARQHTLQLLVGILTMEITSFVLHVPPKLLRILWHLRSPYV